MFSSKDEDDDFFINPNQKSKLSSIFSNVTDNDSSNLMYTPLKQPKGPNRAVAGPAHLTAPAKPVTCVAKVVQTFKMVDGQYQNKGNLGAAIVGSGTDNYQLILYQQKQIQICSVKINREFRFIIQPKNYATFYDSKDIIWSILFDTAINMVEFSMQVALARWKVGDITTTPMMTQDLWSPLGDVEATVPGDGMELSYTLHTVATATKGVEESLSLWTEVEETGWKKALIGLRLTGKRAIILQPSMLGELNPKQVAFNGPVVVKITVVHVSKRTHPVPLVDASVTPNVVEQKQEENSQNVQPVADDSPKPSKADLITRMARMGQALPFKTVAPTPSDSDEPEEDVRTQVNNPAPRPRARHQPSSAPTTVLTATPNLPAPISVASNLTSPVALMPHQMAISQPYMVGSMYPASQIDQSQFNMFMSEVRTTNSELRMGINRLTDKVESLQFRLDSSDKNQPSHEISTYFEKVMDNEKQLKDQLQTVLNLLQNSEALRAVTDRPLPEPHPSPPNSSSESEPCVRCAQFESIQESLNEKIKKLEEENEYLKTTSDAQKAALQNARFADQDQLIRIVALQRELREEQHNVSSMKEKIECVQGEKDSLLAALDKKNNSLADLQKTLLEERLAYNKLEQSAKENEEMKIEEVRRSLKEVIDPKPVIVDNVKNILNTVYRLLRVQFKEGTSNDSAYVVSVIASTIRAVTSEYLQENFAKTETFESDSSDVSTGHISQSHLGEDISEKHGMFTSPGTTAAPELDFTSPQICSKNSLQNDIAVIANNSEKFIENSSTTNIMLPEETAQSAPFNTTYAHEPSDVWRNQPPPLPPFEEDATDDEWLNS